MKRFFENEPVITLNNFAGINWKKFSKKDLKKIITNLVDDWNHKNEQIATLYAQIEKLNKVIQFQEEQIIKQHQQIEELSNTLEGIENGRQVVQGPPPEILRADPPYLGMEVEQG